MEAPSGNCPDDSARTVLYGVDPASRIDPSNAARTDHHRMDGACPAHAWAAASRAAAHAMVDRNRAAPRGLGMGAATGSGSRVSPELAT